MTLSRRARTLSLLLIAPLLVLSRHMGNGEAPYQHESASRSVASEAHFEISDAQRARFTELADRASHGDWLRLPELLVLWDPNDVNPQVGFTYNGCLTNGRQGCMPDTVYSWGSMAKVEDFKRRMGSGA